MALRVVNLMKHQFTRDICLCSIYFGGATFEGGHHLLHHLVEEDVGELGVDERAELEGDGKIHSAGTRVTRKPRAEAPHRLQVVEQPSF